MSVFPATTMSSAAPIGPGRLVLVVGPSGAGKDSILAAAKARSVENSRIVFPRRVVTRPMTADENHIGVSQSGFDEALRDGAFAMWWQAHGLTYGLPISIETDIASGRTVVCNASRGIIESSRLRYRNVTSVQVIARPELLAARLEARSRDSDGSFAQRIERNAKYANFSADIVIDNSGALEDAIRMLMAALLDNRVR
jgi:ribose 1,5-bisphosphokinase